MSREPYDPQQSQVDALWKIADALEQLASIAEQWAQRYPWRKPDEEPAVEGDIDEYIHHAVTGE